MRCNHCRQQLGLNVRYYWRMQFCSTACVDSYKKRLGEETRVKIACLDFANPAERRSRRWLPHNRTGTLPVLSASQVPSAKKTA
jgi:hypothetical protein